MGNENLSMVVTIILIWTVAIILIIYLNKPRDTSSRVKDEGYKRIDREDIGLKPDSEPKDERWISHEIEDDWKDFPEPDDLEPKKVSDKEGLTDQHGKRSRTLDEEYAASHGMWVCAWCETLNDNAASSCVACGAIKSNEGGSDDL